MSKSRKKIRKVTQNRMVSKVTSVVLAMAMMLTNISVAPYKMVEAKEAGVSYTFAADTIRAEEYSSGDTRMQITITRSGDLSESSEMVLLSYDMNADYGEDYTLSYEGNTLPKEDSVTGMFSAFRDNRVISNYKENNESFVNALLAENGLSAEGENELAPQDNVSVEQESNGNKSLKDADEEGINYYDSLSTLDKIGAASTRTLLSFAVGEKTKEVTLTVKADELVEYDESFFLGVVSPQVDKYLKKHQEGIPDIALKQGRDIAVTSVTIEDSSEEEPACNVYVDKKRHILQQGEDTVTVSFSRDGATDTFSTVLLKKDGEAYGYFYFAPYQEVQETQLEAGRYEIVAKEKCEISGSKTIIVEKETLNSKKNVTKLKGATVGDGSSNLDTIYEYDSLPDKSTKNKKGNVIKKASLSSNGNPDWFPSWADNSGTKETPDYIAYTKQSSSYFSVVTDSDYHKGYCDTEYITDKEKEYNKKSIYNTFRLNTSGFCSGTKTNVVRAKTGYYDLTGIDSVEVQYYVDDDDMDITLGVSNANEKKNFITGEGSYTAKVDMPNSGNYTSQYIYFQNDNVDDDGHKHDGTDVYLANAFKLNKRTYQFFINNSDELTYISKAGKGEGVAAEVDSSNRYIYQKMGEKSKVKMNLVTDDDFPMVLTGYQFLDKYGSPIKNSTVSTTSDEITLDRNFLKNYEKHSFMAKPADSDVSYSTFQIKPIMSKIKVTSFDIENGSKDSIYNPYKGELVLENESKELYQGDYVTLSAQDTQDDYILSGVYVKRWKTESSDPQTIIYKVDSSGKVIFKLDAGYSDYEVEPIFSGHETDTVTVTYAKGAQEHGSLTSDDDENDVKPSSLTLVTPEEYQINAYVPLVANPKEGYVTCWYSGNRTYYGNTFYYQMDGNSQHNAIMVDFLKESDVTTETVDLKLSVYENQVNLRNSSAFAEPVPLTDMQLVATSGKTYEVTTDKSGKAFIKDFKGVVGGTYSLMIYQTGKSRYRYVEYVFSGNPDGNVRVPYFSGMSAYPDRVTARIDGTSSNKSYIELTSTGNVEVTVDVYRPDSDTKINEVNLLFCYQGEDGMAKQSYTMKDTKQEANDEDNTGVYDTYTLSVPASEIPDMSYLYVDVKSSYEVLETKEKDMPDSTMTVECDTGYVNTGYKFKTPNENLELAIEQEVPELPGMVSSKQNVAIPFIGSLDFGFSAGNGAYFVRQDDPNTDTWYLLLGYNVASTWAKTFEDRYKAADATSEALKKAEAEAKEKGKSKGEGDIKDGGSKVVKLGGKPVVNIAPAMSLKFTMKDNEDGGCRIVGMDAVIGLDELLTFNLPVSIYGVPCYLCLSLNGEEFFEVHAEKDDFGANGMENAILKPDADTKMSYFIQIPKLDITVKTGVGYNAFFGIYAKFGGNLKMNIEYSDSWKCGGYFYLKGGVGVDLAVFSDDFEIDIPGGTNQEFGNDEARKNIHSASTTVSKASSAAESGTVDVMKKLNDSVEAADENPVFTVSRHQNKNASEGENNELNKILKPAGRNIEVQLVKLSGKKMMALTLEDNGASEDSLNYLSGVYAISDDGGKTWNTKNVISESEHLQWNVKYFKLKDKILLTWSEGDLDSAVGENLTAKSEFGLADVVKALNAIDLKGRYFDLNGNPVGDCFTIAKDSSVAINSLEAAENTAGTVDFYYERRAYNEKATTLTDLTTQEQSICKVVLDDNGRTEAEDKRVLVQSEDGNENYRITELKAFSYKGIEGQVVVLDGDGKLIQKTDNGVEASIEDRQIYLRIISDANGNIPADTLVPVTEAGTCAQHISLVENGGHIYLFWNQNGSIVSMVDFLPTTAEEYEEWCKCVGNFGRYSLMSNVDSITCDTKFRVAMNEKGKGAILWKSSEGVQYSDESLAAQIDAGVFTTDESGEIVSCRGPVSLSGYVSEINNPDIQVLEDGTVLYGCTQLDGLTMYESEKSDAVADFVNETHAVQITQAKSETYPLPGTEYLSYITLRNAGLGDADDLVVSASGALNGTASLKELIAENESDEAGSLNAGQEITVKLPVMAADSFEDGDEVVYTVSRNDEVLFTFKDTVRKGAYIVPGEMANVISIPGTDAYHVSLTVTNMGNQEGETQVHSYTYNQGVQTDEECALKEYDYKDEKNLSPGETTVISFVMKNVAHTDDGIHKIAIETGDGYNQMVEGILPERMETLAGDNAQPENPDQPEEPENPGNEEPSDNSNQQGDTAAPGVGDILTRGSKQTRAKYKVTSSNTVSYFRVKVPSGITSAKVPDTIKISGKTYKVTAIASGAFNGNKKLKKITIGKNVTRLPSKAFYKETKLTTLKISSTKLTKIGSSAFSGCKKLKTITLRSTKLKKKTVKNSLKGSSLKSIKTKSSLKKKYKKYFTKKNAGRKVKIK